MIEIILAFCAGVIVGIVSMGIYLHAHTTAAVAAVTKIYAEVEALAKPKPKKPAP